MNIWFVEPVIGPDNVLPGSWFVPSGGQIRAAEQEANRQYHCANREARTGLKCE